MSKQRKRKHLTAKQIRSQRPQNHSAINPKVVDQWEQFFEAMGEGDLTRRVGPERMAMILEIGEKALGAKLLPPHYNDLKNRTLLDDVERLTEMKRRAAAYLDHENEGR